MPFTTTQSTETAEQKAAYRKVFQRILIFVCVLYILAYMDRTAISYAGPNGMNQDLGLTAATFGLVSGVFFIGYVLFEVPSNLALRRFGAGAWLGRIILSWGIIQALTAFVPNEGVMYAARILLGIAEAGFAPGVLFYLTLWLPARRRVIAFSYFIVMAVVSNIVGAPLLTLIIEWGNSMNTGFAGWRLMILLTGILPIIFGIWTFFYLPKGPKDARWLTQREKDLIEDELATERSQVPDTTHSVWSGLRSPKVWILGAAYFTVPYSTYTLSFFLPTVVTGFKQQFNLELSPVQVGLLVAIPSVVGALAAILVARSAARRGHLGLHVAVVCFIAAAGATLVGFSTNPVTSLIALSLVSIGAYGAPAVFLSIIPKLFNIAAVASALALVNSIANASGFAGPYVTGSIISVTGSTNMAFVVVGALIACGGLTIYLVDRRSQPPLPHRRESFTAVDSTASSPEEIR